jgi:uncharacterized OB-fold protein
MANKVNAMNWRAQRVRYRLEGNRCMSCGVPVFPPLPRCPECIERMKLQIHAKKKQKQELYLAEVLFHVGAYEMHPENLEG